MATTQFKLPIGAKRQVTIPRDLMSLLSIEEGSELLLKVVGDHVTLTPLVSVPRNELPKELRLKFEARRGKKSSDISLSEFLSESRASTLLESHAKALLAPGVKTLMESRAKTRSKS